jgi:glyoxylase-like metal-dependent hydrolase (beta-lactamase superfamily II)
VLSATPLVSNPFRVCQHLLAGIARADCRVVLSGHTIPPVSGALELYLFDSGTLALGGVEVPVPFFLLRHPQGLIVVDGGNPLAVARDPHAHWGGLADVFEVHMSEAQHCEAQLREIGVGPDDVSHIVQTHLHIDHTGALGHFPNAVVVVHAREREAALAADDPMQSGYIRGDYDRPALRWQTVEGDTDLFGDGLIRLVETPGHAAGHMSLLIDLADTGSVLITADASDNLAQWEGRAHVRAFHSRADAARSLRRLHELADETGAMVVFGHDPENWVQLQHAPEPYR